MPVMRNLVLLLLVSLSSSLAYAQEEAPKQEEKYAGRGFTMHGTTGLFSAIAPTLLHAGNIMAGFSWQSEFGDSRRTSPPVSIGYGLAQLSEAYVSFEPGNLGDGREENMILAGLKLLGLEFSNYAFGLGGEYRTVSTTQGGADVGTYDDISGRLLLGANLADLRIILNAGYRMLLKGSPLSTDGIMAALGLSYPLSSVLLIAADGDASFLPEQQPDIHSNLGGRVYLWDHLQLNFGVQANVREGTMYSGAFVGLGFSSEILRAGSGEDERGYIPELPSLDDLDKERRDGVNGGAPGGTQEKQNDPEHVPDDTPNP